MTEETKKNESLAEAMDTAYDAGIEMRRAVMGDDFVDAALERNAGKDGEELQKHISATVWGSIWNRPGLEKRDRSLLNIGMLVALRATGELRGHVRGGLRNGLTREEITEAVIQTAGYCGAPAALSAMKVVQEVLVEELGPLQGEERPLRRAPLRHPLLRGRLVRGPPLGRHLRPSVPGRAGPCPE